MAAKAKINVASMFVRRPKTSRPGVHAKSKNSKNKTSKNYAKAYRGQGKWYERKWINIYIKGLHVCKVNFHINGF